MADETENQAPVAPDAAPGAADPVVETQAQPEAAAAPATFLQQLESAVIAAEKAGEHASHALLNDLHMLSVQIKAKATHAVDKIEGEAGALVQALHRFL